MPVTMKCGHTAMGTLGGDPSKPVCPICIGFTPDAEIVVDAPDLTGREMRCSCMKVRPSSRGEAFFEHRPDYEYDSYYCGHAGWD